MIRVELPAHLRTLARVTDEVAPERQLQEVAGDITAHARETSLDE